ncbi:hypothetical protein BDBG_04103 [Blastomyces gilchristii SLH14081]|uniref:Uncharacterized protein n=1 Tax=Blastomyces gilchristii (strain SLH14081) TaxID=559298 RepID=A0A179UNX6_BLAGS|nr:uncharacterized protein BDBG_04103 [Blastomyces gilchristii SLH14081]OAT08112.1 hypothetical protein BDBG_04103 [Blastomyces gilchristii SLH14081]
MNEQIPLIVLDSDDEDDIQITSVSVCAKNRINSDPRCSQGVSNSSNYQQIGSSSAANGVDGQQVTATGQTQGVAHLLYPSTAEWLPQSTTISIERSPYFPLPSPTISLSVSGNASENNQAASPYPARALAESIASPRHEKKAQQVVSSGLPFTKQFFTDMADAIAHVFPYGELARKYKCSVGQVNRALIAVVLDPLMKRNGGLVSCPDSNGQEGEQEERGQTPVQETWNSPNVLINKWNKRHQEMVSVLQRESEGNGLPFEFDQNLVAASGNAEAYWKARNAAFDVHKTFQDARQKGRAEEGSAEQESGHKNLQQQLEDVVEAGEPESQFPQAEIETAAGAALSLQEKEVPEDGSSASSRKRARSSSETVDGKAAPAHGRDSSPSTATSPVLYQLYSPPPSKKAKTITYQSTPTQTSPEESVGLTPSLHHPNPKRPVATDGSSDTYILNKFPYSRRNNTDDHPPPTPSPPSSASSTGSSQSPIAQTPTPLPRSRSLPNSHTTITTTNSLLPNPKTSTPRPNLFTRSTHRHAVTIDKFGNYQRENQNRQKNQYLPPSSYMRDNTLLPRPDDLLRRPPARTQREPTDSGDEWDVYDPYYHAGADETTRVFTEGLWGELLERFGMEKGQGRREKGRERELMGLEFGLAQIEVSGKGKGKGGMLGDFGGDVSGKGKAVEVRGGSRGDGEGENEDGDGDDDYDD